ncbi:MAG: RDD family protein [Dehalococcoidia bacterium]
MAAQFPPEKFIESQYNASELETAGRWRRLSGSLLDSVLGIVTFGAGWLIWFMVVGQRGQTPGKQLVNLYIIRSDGSRAGGWFTWTRELLIKGLLFSTAGSIVALFTFGLGYLIPVLAAAWCLWDFNHQCLWDKVGGTYVAHSPGGFRPLTRGEINLADRTVAPHH